MATTRYDHGGRAYRTVRVNGVVYRIDLASTKHTIYQQYGAVFTGHPQHNVATRDGLALAGYTQEPALVKEYAELWEEASGVNTDEEL